MNKSFKVVFSKARSALMVVNEATSSIQAKGTKTVIAAAAAAMIAGGAMAATPTATPATAVTVGQDGVLTATTTTKDSTATTAYTATGTVTVGTGADAYQWGSKADTVTDTLNSTSVVTLAGGSLVSVDTDQSVASIAGKGSLVINANTSAGAKITEATGLPDETTHDNLNIDMTVFNSKTGATSAETTLTLAGAGARTLAAGTLKTAASDKSDGTANKGVAKIASTGDLTFGFAGEETGKGTIVKPATAYNFDINADTEIASTAAVTHAVGTTTVAADTGLTFSGTSATIGKDVTFANAGLVTVKAPTATFDADYDAAANTGKLLITDASAAATTITIGGTIANGEVKVGADLTTDSKTQAITDTAAVALNGTTVKVGEKAALKPATLTLAGGTLEVQGAVEATDTKVIGQATLATKAGTTDTAVYGSAKLGNVVVENAEATDASTQANSLSVNNVDAKNAVTATSLTVKGATAATASAKATLGGTFTLTAGDFTAGTLSVGSGATVELTAGKFTVNGTGASTNEGTITLATSTTDNFVIGAGNELTNSGLIGGTADAASGAISVAGTLVNVNKAATTDPKADAVTGKVFAEKVTVEKGGVLETDFVAAGGTDKVYVAGTTTVECTFKTALNARLDNKTPDNDKQPADALSLTQAFVLNGGDITDHAGKTIDNFVLATGSSLTVQADKTFTNVIANGGTFDVDGAAVTVGTLDLQSSAASVIGDGVLNVTTLKTKTGNLNVTEGSVNTSLAGLGLEVSAEAIKEKATATVADNTINLAQNGTLVISDYQAEGASATLTKAGLNALTGKLVAAGTGLIDLGNVTIKDIKANEKTGYYDYATVGALGVATTTLKAATVSVADATAIERSQSFGNIFKEGTTGKLTVTNGTLTLNGTGVDSTGYLVAWTSGTGTSATTKLGDVELGANASGGEFVVTGTGKVGNVTKATGAVNTALVVADKGDVTVVGNVDVDSLYVDAGAKLTVDPVASGTTGRSVTASEVEFDGTLVATDTTLTVNNTADSYYTAATKTFNDISYVGGIAQVKSLTAKGDLLVTGDVTVTDTLTGATGKTFYVGNDTTAGKFVVNKMVAGTVFADPAWVNGQSQAASLVAVKSADASSYVNAGRNSIVAIGTDKTDEAVAVFAKSGFKLAETSTAEADKVSAADTKTVNSVLYVNATNPYLGFASATDKTAATFANPTIGVEIGKNSMLALDAANIGTNSVFDKAVVFEQDSVLFVDNAKNGKQIKLSATGVQNLDGADLVYGGNLLMDLKQVEGTTGTLAFSMKDWNEVKDLYGNAAGMAVAYAMFEQGVDNNSSSATFNKWLYTDAYHDSYGSIRTAAKDVASLGATTGVQTMTMDAVNQMGETVQDRVSVLTQRAAGVNVWAAANGGMFEAKSLFDGAGYESDIYSGVLGVDYQFACNAVLGAALTIGTADTDNKNSTVKASTDSDLVGFSVYTSKTFADVLGVSADIGYLTASNDVTANGYGQAWKFSQDTDAFTIGLRTEVLAEVGAVKLVPHIGIRYTALSTDGFEAGYKTEIDDQNVFQMPVGVTVSGDFQTGDWTVAPKFDLSVVPTFGDKDADLKLGITGVNATDDLAVRVIDSNPVQATLGVNATNGAWGFGLNYKLGVGSDDRMNNTFNINVRYAF